MKLNQLLLTLLLLLSTTKIVAQTTQPFPILFWNVENLFDCKHDSLKNDYDFLPESLKHWTEYRYKNKLKKISKTIIASSQWVPPAIIGLCEIENDTVIAHLTEKSLLRNLGYKYICTESKDSRGIDVTLIYQPERFKLINYKAINVGRLPNGRLTRDILHAEGITLSGDTLDIYVAHFPSRFGGQRKSEPNRMHVAEVLRKEIDKIQFSKKGTAKIIVMGDFNDYPQNRCVQEVIKAVAPQKQHINTNLYHLLAKPRRKKEWGTYKYKNEWGVLDHFIVNGNLLNKDATFFTSEEQTEILRIPFLLIKDEKYGGLKPFRTYNGMHYLNGYSDHLPIISTFTEVLDY